MLEMGSKKKQLHLDIGQYLASKEVDYVITVGELGKYIAEGALEHGLNSKNILKVKTKEDAAKKLLNILSKNDTVLIKGSRGMKMEKIKDFVVDWEEN
jgi:UDP-N-acetylmuramoyl-tripeptide--D-alanyl-D-alanine ligase